MTKIMQDGIYFDLPEADYHALNRLSGSGIKDILVSIPTYWAKSAMNKDREIKDKEEIHFVLGHAYHVAVFEPEEYDQRFVGEPDSGEFPKALMSDTAVKKELKDSGQTQTKPGEKAVERAERLRASGYDGEIWSIIMDRWEAKRAGRQALKARYHNQIMRDIERIEANPEIHELVTGGFSEVSILWTDPETGIKMKARLDKLKLDFFLDLKSFVNKSRKPVNQCVRDQIQYERHYIQARLYQRAVMMIKELKLDIVDDSTQEQNDLVRRLQQRETPLECWYVYQEKGGIPNILARKIKLMRHPVGHEPNAIGGNEVEPAYESILARKADVEILHAKQRYLQAMEIYGPDEVWYNINMVDEINDEDFSEFFLEARPV